MERYLNPWKDGCIRFSSLSCSGASGGIWPYFLRIFRIGAIVIGPLTRMLLQFSRFPSPEFPLHPYRRRILLRRRRRLPERMSITMPCCAALRLISSASRKESTEIHTLSIIYFTLFVCRCPIICHLTGRTLSYLSRISCTLFSPISVTPARIASLISSAVCVFVTAQSRISSGFLPALSAASAFSLLNRFDIFRYRSHSRRLLRRQGFFDLVMEPDSLIALAFSCLSSSYK